MRYPFCVAVVVTAAFFCTLCITTDALGQVHNMARISGKVYDAQNLEPLPGATVLCDHHRGTVTDDKGRYRIQVEPGQVSLTFQFVGYRTETRHLETIPGDTMELNIPLVPQVTEINRMVISAGRAEQRLSDLTVSMSLIKPEVLSLSHITDGQELINKTSGVEVLDGQASIRGGSGYSYGAGSRVMVLVDGLPMLSADAGHIRWQSMPLENLSQVEIIKGASSVMYGSSALNGTISFRTDEATREGVTKFFTEGGMYGNPRNKDWIWHDNPRMFSSASVSHLQRYGNTDIGAGAFLQFDEGYRRLNDNKFGRLNLKVKQYDKKITGLHYGVSANAMYTRKQDFVLWENAWNGALRQDTSTAQRLFATSIAIDPAISFRHGSRFSHDLRSRILFTQNDYPDGEKNGSDAFSQYVEYQFRYSASRIISLNAGLTHYTSQIQSELYNDHHARNAAAYAQADLTPANRMKLVAGVRLEHNNLDGIQDRIVPLFRAGINYRVFDKTFLRASWGQGYRYPSIAEKHASTTLGSVKIIPNLQIQSESGWNSEIAVKQGIWTPDFDGLIDLALFYSQNKDMIEFVFGIYPDPVTQLYGYGFRATNIEYSRVYGFELEYMLNARYKQIHNTLSGGYVYMYPVEFNPNTNKNTGVFLKFRRKHSFTLNLTTSWHQFDFGLHAYARSPILNIDKVFLDPDTRESVLPGFYDYWTEHNDSYFLMDASIGYRLKKHYKISLALKNLTNTEYIGRPGDIQPHRHLSLRISGTF